MTPGSRFVLFVFTVFCAATAVIAGQTAVSRAAKGVDPIVGTWKANFAKSKLDPVAPAWFKGPPPTLSNRACRLEGGAAKGADRDLQTR
jgi:hypothetical protein